MNNHVQKGDVINHVAGAAYSAGDVVVIGAVLGVAVEDIANGATGPVRIAEVVAIPKNTSTAMAQGDRPYWDISAGELAAGTPATGDLQECCVVVTAAGASDTTADVLLNVGGGAVITA